MLDAAKKQTERLDRILENQPSPRRIKEIKKYLRKKRRKMRRSKNYY